MYSDSKIDKHINIIYHTINMKKHTVVGYKTNTIEVQEQNELTYITQF